MVYFLNFVKPRGSLDLFSKQSRVVRADRTSARRSFLCLSKSFINCFTSHDFLQEYEVLKDETTVRTSLRRTRRVPA